MHTFFFFFGAVRLLHLFKLRAPPAQLPLCLWGTLAVLVVCAVVDSQRAGVAGVVQRCVPSV
jgi:hypothetical protein